MNGGEEQALRSPPRRGRGGLLLVACLALAIGGGIGFAVAHRLAGGEEKPEEHAATEPAEAHGEKQGDEEHTKGPVATVQTVALAAGKMARQRSAFGVVTAEPGETHVVSVAFECRVVRTRVTPGQVVAADAAVVQVEPSPDVRLAVLEADRAVTATAADLERVKAQFEARLATNQDLSSATTAAETAKLRAASLRERGATETRPRDLQAGAAGIVARVMVQQGQIVPAGGPLLEIVPTAAVEVRLGVEPGTVLREGQVVSVTSALASADPAAPAVEGHVRLSTSRVSPDTRLVDAFVSLPKEHGLPLDLPVVSRWTDEPAEGFVVPRSAVLPTDEGFVLFAVSDGHAKRHPVTILAEEGDQILVKGADLHPDDQVVTVGNFELTDGMAVEVHAAEAEGAATKPSTAPSTAPAASSPAAVGAEK
jgi:membrane fusion protein (multidrug efflux system)